MRVQQNNLMVTIVIPVYNGENYLEKAIQSACNQTYSNIEIIVVNDGSDDNGATREIAMRYKDKIRYFEKENGGVASAVNAALKEMKGEYFAWLSHDDEYYPDKIETQVAALRNCGDMMRPVFGGFDIYDMVEEKITPCIETSPYVLENMEKGAFPILSGVVNTVTVMVHRSHFERCGVFNEQLISTQDYDMWFRIFRNNKPLYIPKVLIKWRNHPEQGTNTISSHHHNCDILNKSFLCDILKKPEEIEEIYGSRYRFLFEFAEFCLKYRFMEAHKFALGELGKCSGTEYTGNPQLHECIGNMDGGKIICFGSGTNGRYMERALMVRGIDIDCYADNSMSKWNTKINGHICMDPASIDREKDVVIVTILHNEAVLEQLKQMGIKHVLKETDLDRPIHYALPKKDRIKEFFDTVWK